MSFPLKNSLLFLLALLFGCSQADQSLEEDWEVQDPFYKAIYRLQPNADGWYTLVIYYDDGTTNIQYRKGTERYLFKRMKEENGSYVDGISGATKTQKKEFSIQQIHLDTLRVSQFILHDTLHEIWTRKHR